MTAETSYRTVEHRLPALSIVLVPTTGIAGAVSTLRRLQQQTISDQIELVIVVPETVPDTSKPLEIEGFRAVRVVRAGTLEHPDEMLAHGARAATASVVAFVEDHAFPEPGWAEACLRAHGGPWAGVGTTLVNANPDSMLSWANMLLAYGRWLEPTETGETDLISRHNSSYKRNVLESYDDSLDRMLGRSGGFFSRLREDGHRLYLESDARISHLNPSRLWSTIALRVRAGRLSAATRASEHGWSRSRRLLYVAGAPLIPLLRFGRMWPDVRATQRHLGLGPRVFAALFLALLLDALGQMAGFAFGPGDTANLLERFEVDRRRHLGQHDKHLLPSPS